MRTDVLMVDSKSPDGTNAGDVWQDSTTTGLFNANVSPTYKPFEWMTAYFTYNYSQFTDVGNGGGYSAGGLTGQKFNDSYFHKEAFLYELGTKFELLNKTLFVNADVFMQDRIQSSLGGAAFLQHLRGFESELNYQPNKAFLFTGSYAFIHSTSVDPGFTSAVLPTDKLAAQGILPSGGAGIVSGEGETPGVPEHVFNMLAAYRHDSGFGASLGMTVTSQMNLGYGSEFRAFTFAPSAITRADTVQLPWQYTVDMNVFYRKDHWDINLAFLNLTDERNYSPPNAVYGNSSVTRDLPFRMEGTIKYIF
jgi:hypothetical protein